MLTYKEEMHIKDLRDRLVFNVSMENKLKVLNA